MRSTSLIIIVCSSAVLAGCSGQRAKTPDTSRGEVAVAPQGAAAGTAISLADIAGTWNVRAVPQTGDTTRVTTAVLHAKTDTAGWTMDYATQPQPIVMHVVALAGDSIALQAEPYMSARRPGMKAVTRDVYRLVNGQLVGYSVGYFLTTTDTIRLRLEATRAP